MPNKMYVTRIVHVFGIERLTDARNLFRSKHLNKDFAGEKE